MCKVLGLIPNAIKKKKKEILLYGTPWMNLKDIMLSEVSQSKRINAHDYMKNLKCQT